MRTQTVIIIEKEGNQTLGTYCNDSNYELPPGDWAIDGLGKGVDYVEIVSDGTMEECGGYHRSSFHGDCREDDERFWPVD